MRMHAERPERRRRVESSIAAIERLEDRTLLSAGAMDASFGIGGLVSTDLFGGSDEQVTGMALQADGKVVVTGYVGGDNTDGLDVFVARYNVDGSLDSGFGIGGVAVTNLFGHDTGNAIAIQADGKIVVGGSASGPTQGFSRVAFVRFNPDGSLDDGSASDSTPGDGFGNGDSDGVNGAVLIDVVLDNLSNTDRSGEEHLNGIVIQEDGKILGVGAAKTGATSSDIALVRLHGDGSLDMSFDGDSGAGNGIVVTDVSDIDAGIGLVILGNSDNLGNDKIVVGARVQGSTTGQDFALLRYHSDGSLDNTFDGDGVVATDFGAGVDDFASALALQADGKVVLGGSTSANGTVDLALARYNVDGGLDIAFGSGGQVITDVNGGVDAVNGLAMQPDGRILAVGRAQLAGEQDFVVARFSANGGLDASFDDDGIVTTDFPAASSEETAVPVAVQSDGKIVVAGYTRITGDPADLALARFDPGAFNVDVDITQGTVNLGGNAMLSVVIRTTETFDAAQVNAATVVLAGANISQYALQDVDGDGDLDLVLHFRMDDLRSDLLDLYAERLAEDVAEDGDLDSNRQIIEAVLIGSTFSSEMFQGADELEVFLSGKALKDFLAARGIVVS